MLTKQCLQCGTIFEKQPTVSMNNWNTRVKYCSRKCSGIAQTKPATKLCKFCNQPFKPKHWEGRTIYCSIECFSNDRRKSLPFCVVCGKPCKKLRRKFCSPECKIKWYRGSSVYNYVGENFRKDAYPVDYSAWKTIASEIRNRDKVCVGCGKTPKDNGRALDVHHIIPYRISFDNSPSNLVALCMSCHKKADAGTLTQLRP